MEACEKILSFFEKAGYRGIAIGHEIFVENGEKRIKARFFPSLRSLAENLEHAISEYHILIVPAGEDIHEYMDVYKRFFYNIYESTASLWVIDVASGNVSPIINDSFYYEFYPLFLNPSLSTWLSGFWDKENPL
ncbi:MAG: hypothetical protein DRN88_02785 [Candidatus Hydrothermarchaeota archaeon]|nr:MAG: hypothetical protein DRN88_02785 [Candidatus Hydrothermarchaeota archaeon]